jgi:HNH endonuclease
VTELPSQEYLRSRIDYNPETGEARWKPVDDTYDGYWKSFNKNKANTLLPLVGVRIDKKNYTLARLIYKIYYGTDIQGHIDYIDGDLKNLRINNISVRRVKVYENKNRREHLAIDIDLANQLLAYNHIDGTFIWRPRENNKFNARYAGREAGSVFGGYRSINFNNRSYKAHRLAWVLYYGVDPSYYVIDHVDNEGSNNSISNLRLATQGLNISVIKRNETRAYKKGNKWWTQIAINNKHTYLGTYDTEQEARAAYKSAIEKYKPIYQFTSEEQAMLDELYANYPNVTRELQHACHALQVKALNHYTQAIENETLHCNS